MSLAGHYVSVEYILGLSDRPGGKIFDDPPSGLSDKSIGDKWLGSPCPVVNLGQGYTVGHWDWIGGGGDLSRCRERRGPATGQWVVGRPARCTVAARPAIIG